MDDQLRSMVSQTASGFLGAVITALVGIALPQSFRVPALLAAAVWIVALYRIGRKPARKDVLETIKYLDALHDHKPQLISDADYYRRLNRQLVLDGLSSKQFSQGHPTIESIVGEKHAGDSGSAERAMMFTTLIRWLFILLLPAAHGAIWALSRAGAMSGILGTVLGSWPFLLLVIIVMSVASYRNVRQLPAPTMCDLLTLLFGGCSFWGIGYLLVFVSHGAISIRPFLLSVSLSLFGLSLAGYIPYRRSIDKNVRHRLEVLTLFTGIAFFGVGVLGYVWLFVEPIDFASMQALTLVLLVGLSGLVFVWLCGLQWDLVLDVVVDSCGDAAQRGVLTDIVTALVQEARVAKGSIIGLVPATALFALVMGICTLLAV